MEQHIITIENTTVRVCEWGNKTKPTIVFLHGLGNSSLDFLEIPERLQDEYHILSVDLPGHGKTEPFENEDKYGAPYLTKWLAKVIAHFEVDKYYILGHSWGGDIAVHFSVNFPEKVKKILLLDGGYLNFKKLFEYFKRFPKKVREDNYLFTSIDEELSCLEKDFEKCIASTFEEAYNKILEDAKPTPYLDLLIKDSIIEEPKGCFRWQTKKSGVLNSDKSIYNYPPDEYYDKIKTPSLLLQASEDEYEIWSEIKNEFAENFKQNVKNSIVKKVKTSHGVHFDDPELVIKETRAWFK